jgi:flagellar hook-basal body complex protein FliE
MSTMSTSFNVALNAYSKVAKMPMNAGVNSAGGDENALAAIGGTFSNKVSEATNALKNAEIVTAKSLVKQADLTDVVSAITKAEVTLRTVVELRDKLVSAHQEILRMPI